MGEKSRGRNLFEQISELKDLLESGFFFYLFIFFFRNEMEAVGHPFAQGGVAQGDSQ